MVMGPVNVESNHPVAFYAMYMRRGLAQGATMKRNELLSTEEETEA
jgi:hypothetical protein